MIRYPQFAIAVLALLGLTAAPVPPRAATPGETINLLQDRSVMLKHQSQVGNVRAQARRVGLVRHVPQLYVYHADRSQAYHMDGHRPRFERELSLTLDRFRPARSMVDLETLIARTRTADGERLDKAELPDADVTLVVYRRIVCEECDRVEADLAGWLEENPQLDSLWIRVFLDGQLPE